MDQIFSIKKGKGNPVILIHGFCETHKIWNQVSDYLSSHYTVYAIDLPGFGESPLPVTPFSIIDIANFVWDWIVSNKIEKPVIIGHSLGGYVSLEIALKNPDLLSGLGLFHSSTQADSSEKKENRDKVIEFVSRNGAKPFLNSFVPTLFFKKDNPLMDDVQKICGNSKKESIINYSVAMRDRSDYQNVVGLLNFPILFLCGENDTFMPIESSRKQADFCQKPYFFILDQCGHLGMIENPEQAVSNIILFLTTCF